MRKPHLLKQTAGKERPQNVVFFDTETNQDKRSDGITAHTLKLGFALFTRTSQEQYCQPQSELVFHEVADFWNTFENCIRSKTKTYLVAHNIVFDLTVLDGFNQLTERGWKLESFYSKSFTSIFRWKKDSRTLIALDNGNFFRGKLATWGKILGIPKLEVDFETVNDADLLTYCKTDVEIIRLLWISWLRFLDDNNLGSFKVTVASTAFNAWRYRFMPSKVHIHDNELALSIERESYRGGRVEVYYQGRSDNGPFYYIDVNNMYGYVLANHEFPCALLGVKETNSVYMLRRKLARYGVVARVTLNVTEPVYPLSLGEHTVYPLGRFQTTLTTPEIKRALDNGWVEELHAFAWYRQEPLFAEYVTYFHKLRQEYGDTGFESYSENAKLMVNSLYGKFGQRGFNQENIGVCEPGTVLRESVFSPDTGEYHSLIFLAGSVFKEWRSGESYHSFPAIAAHVTAYARLYLFDLKSSVPRGHVYYMDTDSLIVDGAGHAALAPLLDPKQLGLLKVERESSFLEVNAPKDYAMDGRIKRKGISDQAVQLDSSTFQQEQWIRLDGMIRKGSVDGYMTKTVRKHLRREVHQGTVLPSGWVEPLTLDLPRETVAAPRPLSPAER